MRKKVRIPKLRVMINVGYNRYEWHSPIGMSQDELEVCGVVVFTDFQSGCKYSPILL